MSFIANHMIGFGARSAGGGNDSYTKILLHMDGADASTTFTDSSSTGTSVTAVSSAQVDTAQSKFGGASLLVNGTTSYLTWSHSSDFDFADGDFSIDAWVRFNSVSGTQSVYVSRSGAGGAQKDIVGLYWGANEWTFSAMQNTVAVGKYRFSHAASTGTWYHIAVARKGTSFYMFLDGTSQSLTTDTAIGTNSVTPTFGTPTPAVGRYGDVSNFYFNGWIDEFRISKGIARWTASFTTPTIAYF